MKVIRSGIFVLIIIFSIGRAALAQSENKLACTAMVKKDSVVLRWAPSSIPLWQTGITYGYVIKRYTISKGGVFIPDGLSKEEILTPGPIRPSGQDVFEKISLIDSRAAVVEEAIYGSGFQLPAPANNFNSFMKAYNDLEVRFGFALFICDLSSAISQAAGLWFTDRNINRDERYVYSISPANIPDGMQVGPAVVVIDAGLETKLPPVTDVQAVFLDKAVKFRWPVSFYKGTYTAYSLEKSTDGISFASATDLPLVNLTEDENLDSFSYTDSLKDNNQQTWYRVKGISPFGEEGPASDIVSGKGAPEFTSYSVIDTAEVIENSKIIVRWRVSHNDGDLVKGVSILRSDKSDGVYEKLNARPMTPDVESFTDTHPGLSNYYKVELSGKENLTSSSFPYFVQTEDNDPPAAPQMLSGTVGSSGVVTIVWKGNTESDLLGYKVFRSNNPGEEFIPLDRDMTSRNICLDTINLNTLTQEIYYQVIAVDKRFNTSDYSDILQLSRPDTIRPAPALITRIDINNGKAIVHFENSPSPDVVMYELYRMAENDTVSEMLKFWKKNLPAAFEDVPDIPATNYYYQIRTRDLAGNNSKNSRTVYFPGTDNKKVALRAEPVLNGKSILISWDIPEGIKPVKTILYRGTDSSPISIHHTLDGAGQTFADSDIEINTDYRYLIKIFDENGKTVVTSGQITTSALSGSESESNQN